MSSCDFVALSPFPDSEQYAAELLRALLLESLEVLVDDGDGEQDTGSAPDRSHEVSHDGEHADAHASESRGGGDVAVELLLEGGLTVTHHEHLLLLELLSDIARRGAGDLDPGLGEQGACAEHEGEVKDGVKRVRRDVPEAGGRGDVVRQASHGDELASALGLLPATKELDQEVASVAFVQQLGDEVEVGHQRGLQDDGHVRRVEELDGVSLLHAAAALGRHRKVDPEALEVDHHEEDQNRGQQVGDVRQVGAVECLLERAHLVSAGDEEVEERNDSTLELGTLASVHSRGAERLPNDALALVRGDEKGNTGAETITLGQELIEADDDDASHEQLDDDQDGVARAKIADVTVDAGNDVGDGLADGNENAKELLSTVTAGSKGTREIRFVGPGKIGIRKGRGKTDRGRMNCGQGDRGGASSGRTHRRALSSFTASSTSIILEPARSCMTRPDVTIGLIPSSMHVPRFEAIITRAQ